MRSSFFCFSSFGAWPEHDLRRSVERMRSKDGRDIALLLTAERALSWGRAAGQAAAGRDTFPEPRGPTNISPLGHPGNEVD